MRLNSWTRLTWRCFAVLAGYFLCTANTSAVITLAPADSNRNSTAPQGTLLGSGWQLQGAWGSFLGTPIGPRHFITATHAGGAVGDVFVFRGNSYRTTAHYADPQSDLSLWSVSEDFPEFAFLYSEAGEIGQSAILFGRGGQRGSAVEIRGGFSGPQRRGWLWGPQDGVMRWGTNLVEAVVRGEDLGPLVPSGSVNADFLKLVFNADGGADEAHLSPGDSGGGLFIKTGNAWKLAGVHCAVDGPYNTTTVGPGFGAAIYDEGGLYKGGEGEWSMVPDGPEEQGGALYSTRISSRLSWIEAILAIPPPESVPTVQFQTALGAAFVDQVEAEIDPARKSVRVPLNSAFRNYRLRSTRALLIRNPRVEAGKLEFTYE